MTAASSRFVMLRQDFDPPLVIGYLGFDREILRDGEGVYLGPPVSTNSVLTENQVPREGRPFFTAYRTDLRGFAVAWCVVAAMIGIAWLLLQAA